MRAPPSADSFPKLPTTVGAGPRGSHEPRLQPGYLAWVTKTHTLEPLSAAYEAHWWEAE